MIVAQTISELREHRANLGRLALVPTMGALHEGHVSLIQTARQHAPDVAVSIFVNPTQFGRGEDYTRYPRPLEQDLARCRDAGASLVFAPEALQMYPPGASPIVLDLPELTDTMEGKHRPGHFRGVCQVVAKLFNQVQPQVACFGQKDFQQLRVIEAMVQALDFPIQIVPCPTLREKDGLAMSSRNQYLTPDERQRALAISRALFQARDDVAGGVRQTNRLVATMRKILLDVGSVGGRDHHAPLGHVPVSIDYVAAVDPATLRPVESIIAPTLLAIAARVGTTRLIDNVVVGSQA
jgi:pantoate--beta-alanine ligase